MVRAPSQLQHLRLSRARARRQSDPPCGEELLPPVGARQVAREQVVGVPWAKEGRALRAARREARTEFLDGVEGGQERAE